MQKETHSMHKNASYLNYQNRKLLLLLRLMSQFILIRYFSFGLMSIICPLRVLNQKNVFKYADHV